MDSNGRKTAKYVGGWADSRTDFLGITGNLLCRSKSRERDGGNLAFG